MWTDAVNGFLWPRHLATRFCQPSPLSQVFVGFRFTRDWLSFLLPTRVCAALAHWYSLSPKQRGTAVMMSSWPWFQGKASRMSPPKTTFLSFVNKSQPSRGGGPLLFLLESFYPECYCILPHAGVFLFFLCRHVELFSLLFFNTVNYTIDGMLSQTVSPL